VDFAYAVHTDIGNRCVACRINHELMPLRTELRNGDQVEIISAAHANPNPAWLSYVKTGKARSQIRHFLKTMQYEESAALGERLLAQALRPFELAGGIADAVWDKFVLECGAKSKMEVLTDIGLGKRLPAIVARRLAEGVEADPASAASNGRGHQAILIHGPEGVAVRLGDCCRPIPGDPSSASSKSRPRCIATASSIASRGRGERAKWVDVEWERDSGRLFEVSIKVEAENRRGVLAKVAAEIAEAGSNIQHVTMDDEHGVYTSLYFTLQVSNRVHLARVLRALRHIPEVVRISRVRE
jgi:guanosine-3',5'-bis(diphosphate) 3'-pyrophosphohydrolase